MIAKVFKMVARVGIEYGCYGVQVVARVSLTQFRYKAQFMVLRRTNAVNYADAYPTP